MITELTKEQEGILASYRQKYLDKCFDNKNDFSESYVVEVMQEFYKMCGLDKPLVLYLDSPMACQLACNLLCLEKDNTVENIDQQVVQKVWQKVVQKVSQQVDRKVFQQVREQIYQQVDQKVWKKVWQQIDQQVDQKVTQQVFQQSERQVDQQVFQQVREQVTQQVFQQEHIKHYSASFYGSSYDLYWVSFFSFFEENFSFVKNDYFEICQKVSDFSFYMIALSGLCVVSKYPVSFERNSEKQLHSVEKPSVFFGDGYCQHYINGSYIPQDLFEKIKTDRFKMSDFLSIKNEEIKSNCIEMMELKNGSDYLYHFFSKNLLEIDTFIHKKEDKFLEGTTKSMNIGVYTLFSGRINNENVSYVRCYCPSTDRMFFLGCEPIFDNAKDAISSLYKIPSFLSKEIKYIQRQGERYSTVFTEKGKKLLQERKQDLGEMISISGDEYFNKLTYEY